jgi:ankyrin repeat protein
MTSVRLESKVIEAARDGSVEALEAAIAEGCGVDEKDWQGWTATMVVCNAGFLECLKILLAAGASARSASTISGSGLLHIAAMNGRTEIVRYLGSGFCGLEELNFMGQTPLLVAAQKGRAGCVAMLLELGADALAVDEDGTGVLALAKSSGSGECVGLVLSFLERAAFEADVGGASGRVLKKSL